MILNGNMQEVARKAVGGSALTISKLTPGSTYYLYLESELSNGTGTVTSAVMKIIL